MDKPDQREVVKSQLEGRTEELLKHVTTVRLDDRKWTNKNARLGAEIMTVMMDGHGGEDRLRQFAEWAVHPRSGFLPQTEKAKPLPDDLKAWFEKQANVINKIVGEQHLPDAPQPPSYYPEHHVSIDELTLVTSKVLENFLTPEQEQQAGLRR